MTDLTGKPSPRRIDLPTAAEMAAAIRGGDSPATLAAEFNCSATTIKDRLILAGYNSATGELRQPKALEPFAGFVHQPEPWMAKGSCVGRNPEHWDHDTGVSKGAKYALRVCDDCPVREACLDYALRVEEHGTGRHGILGATLPEDRAALVKRGVA